MTETLLEYVKDGLVRYKARRPEIAEATAIYPKTLYKIATGVIKDPRIKKIERIAAWLRVEDSKQLIEKARD